MSNFKKRILEIMLGHATEPTNENRDIHIPEFAFDSLAENLAESFNESEADAPHEEILNSISEGYYGSTGEKMYKKKDVLEAMRLASLKTIVI